MAIARSLHRQGVPVDVASFVPAMATRSRAIRDFRTVPRPELDPAGFVSQLRDLIRQGGPDLLIPADDQAVVALTEHYREFKNVTQIASPPPEITDLVLDKSSTLNVARECGISVPKTTLISNSVQLPELSSTFPFPWVLKPARKELTVEEIKSFRVAIPAEVVARFPSPREFSPPMLLQEYCEGAGVGVELLMHEGECRAAFQHRRLEEVPHTGGVSVTAVAEPLDPVLFEKSLDLLRALRWEGPAMVEFKVNPRDGSAVLMEVNGRYWGTISLPILAGIDFPLYHWQLLHGVAPGVPRQYAIGTKWKWTAGHVWRLHGLLIAARRSRSARQELLRSYSRGSALFDPSVPDPLFSTSDPMPAVFDLVHIVKHLSAYDAKALWGRLSRAWSRSDN